MKRLVLIALLALASPLSAEADGRHADPQLEAQLPASLGGVMLAVESQSGSDLMSNSAAFDAFLASLGKARSDFVVASAYSTGDLKAAVSSWRVKGAASDRLMPGFRAAVQASSAKPLGGGEELIAGKSVARIGDPGQLAQGPIYAYVRGDTVFFVQTPDHALAEEAIAKLPP